MKTRIPILIALCFGFGILFSFNSKEVDKGYEIAPNPSFTNLKVLPKDISDDDLKGIMRGFNDALGVKCSFCHAPGADGKMDFASDANKHKDVARKMLKMTKNINKKHFQITDPKAYKVTCYTCHNGSEHPAKAAKAPEVLSVPPVSGGVKENVSNKELPPSLSEKAKTQK